MRNTIKFATCLAYLVLCTCPGLWGQNHIPEFSMPFYWEDAQGNKDTTIIGYDTLGGEFYNPFIDGELLDAPFDSVLDVRVLHFGDREDGDQFATKKTILAYEHFPGWSCGVSDIGIVAVHCKYPPLKMYYDSTLLGLNTCRSDTWMATEQSNFIIQYWWNLPFTCLGATSSLVPPLGNGVLNDTRVLGMSNQNLQGFYMTFKPWGACSDPSLLPTAENTLQPKYCNVAPNPATEQLSVRFATAIAGVDLLLYNVLGQPVVIKHNTGEPVSTVDINVAHLPNGLYYLQLSTGLQRYALPVVVQR